MGDGMVDWTPRDGIVIGVPLILMGLFVVLRIIPLERASAAFAAFWILVGLYIWLAKRMLGLGLLVATLAGAVLWWTLTKA
jgi:hypothetical protein